MISDKSDLTGRRFGKLMVIEFIGIRRRYRSWRCICDCGNIVDVIGSDLKRKQHGTKSCGCSRKGKKLSEAHKRKVSENHADVRGKNNPNYKSNLTDEDRVIGRFYPGYKDWRKAVYERDKYTCQVCGDSTGGNLNAHHIESYNSNPDLRTKLSNGVTTCETCHKDFHHQYGYGNNTKAQWEEFINVRS